MASYNPNNLSPDELSCPICFEEFCTQSSSEHAPKLLLCLHTFCLGCIRNLVRSNRTLQCSICRTEHTDVSPQELFDNYVIMEYVRKQQEESDARLAQQHSDHLMEDRSDQPGHQQRQEQLLRDAELARQYQQFYDMERNNTGGDDAAALPPCSMISAPTVSVVQRPEVLCTAQESSSQPRLVASCSRPSCPPPPPPTFGFSRNTSTSASSSSPSTSSVVTISSNTFSDSSSDDRCSSRESSSSRQEEEFVDSVEILEMDSGSIAGAIAVAADDGTEEDVGDIIDVSGSSRTASALSPAYTNNSGFSHHDDNDDSHEDVEDAQYNENDDHGSDMDNSFRQYDDNNDENDSDDGTSLHLGETFSEHFEDDGEEVNLDGDNHHDSDHDNHEDELFNNLSVLEAIDRSPEGSVAAPGSHDLFSADDSCISISSTESYSGITPKDSVPSGQNNPIRRNFPLSVHSDLSDSGRYDDHTLNTDCNDTASTITLNDCDDSTSNATNKTYNTRSRSANITKSDK